MSYELFISLRHLRARRRQKFISLITWISIGGVAVGVMALIVVIAVMSGFGKDLRDKILGTYSHIVVSNFSGEGIQGYESVIRDVKSVDGVVGASPFIFNQVMLTHKDRVSGVVIRGVDPDRVKDVSDLAKNLVDGKLSDLKLGVLSSGESNVVQRDGIFLGRELARSLGAYTGDNVSMISPVVRITPLGLIPRMKIFKVVGLFETGMFEYDSSLAFISLKAAQIFFAMKQQATGVEIRVANIDHADQVAINIQERLGFPYHTRDWMSMNRNLFSALKMEKITMFVILILIILVAAFNIISTLFMVVMEKNKEIAILKSMGASKKSIIKIFSYEGLIIGVCGTILGVIGGFSIVHNLNDIIEFLERTLGIDIFPKDVYFLSKIPSEIQYMDSLLIVVFSIVICFAASLYPAWRASRLEPIEGLRYE